MMMNSVLGCTSKLEGEADVFLRLVHIGSGRDSEFMDQFAEPV